MKGLTSALPAARLLGAGVATAALAGLATLAIGAGVLLDATRERAELAGRRVTVAVIAAEPLEQGRRAATILGMLRRRSDLYDARAVPEAEVRAQAGDGGPLPALLDMTLAAGRDEAQLSHALAGLPGVTVTRAAPPPTTGTRALARIARTLAGVAMLGGMAVGVGLALSVDAPALALFEQLGAGDRQITRAITERSLGALVVGSVTGTALAIPFIVWQAHVADAAGVRAIPISGWATMALAALLLPLFGCIGASATTALRLRRRG